MHFAHQSSEGVNRRDIPPRESGFGELLRTQAGSPANKELVGYMMLRRNETIRLVETDRSGSSHHCLQNPATWREPASLWKNYKASELNVKIIAHS